MSWTGFQVSESEIEEAVRERLVAELVEDKHAILELAASEEGDYWYAACQVSGRVIGAVICLRRAENGICRFKVVTEGEGPMALGAPSAVLDKLTPTDDETSRCWRAGCRKVAAGEDPLDPYQSFTNEGETLPDGVASFLDAAERKAYADGISARQSGISMDASPYADMEDGGLLYLQWWDGWAFEDNRQMVAEFLANQ